MTSLFPMQWGSNRTKWAMGGVLVMLASALAAGCSSGGGKKPDSGAGGSPTGGSGGTGGVGGGTGGGGGSGGTGGGGAGGGGAGGGGSGGGGAGDARDSASGEASAPDVGNRDTASGADVAGGPFALTSSVFKEGEIIALKYRCRTENVSPPLSWTPGPPGTKSYAVTMIHTPSLHWAIYDIPADVTSLPEDVAKVAEPPVPAGSKQVKPNVDGSTWFGYSGPCPGGTSLQRYDYTVYALSVEKLQGGITPQSTIREADTAIKAVDLASATLTATARGGM
jgi:Raf kinase inhibitor-like YbhB/YbcL family protein